MTTYDENGRVKSLAMVSTDASGNFNFDTSTASTKRKEFSLLSSQIATATNKTYLDAGKKALMGIGGKKSEQLTEAFEEIVTGAGHRSTTKTGQEMMLSLNDTASSKAGAVIYRAKNEGWATNSEASVIAGEMIVEAYTGKNQHRVLADAGLGNPYHTMFAIESAINNKKINNSDGLGQLGGSENLMNLYQAYRTETAEGRSTLDAKLEANNYFEGKVGPLFGNVHKTIKSVIDKGIEGTEENLVREYDNLFNRKPDVTVTPIEVEDEVEVSSAISELTIPQQRAVLEEQKGRKLSRPEQLKLIGQQSKYQVLQKANKELQRVLNLDSTVRGNMSENQYQALLKKAQNRFNKQFAEYKNRYGLKDNI